MWNTPETETTGPPTSETPDWLNNDADTESQSGKAWDTADKSSVTTKPTKEISPTTKKDTSSGDKGPWCKRLTIVGISTLFVAGFIYAAIDGKNEGKKLQWYIYYAISAAIPVFFLCHYILCFPVKIIYTLTLGMTIWSIVNIIMAALKIVDHPKGGDEQNQTIHDQLVWELSGVSAGLFSALYHACASKCFVTSKSKDNE